MRPDLSLTIVLKEGEGEGIPPSYTMLVLIRD
jgi:hypothetical protein